MSAVAAFLDHVETIKRGPRRRVKFSLIEAAMIDAKHRAKTGDWENAKPTAFIGLHALCHQMIYGVHPLELDQTGLFRAAARLAARAQHDLFGDDPTKMAEFVRWTWEREKRKNTWAQAKQVERNRLSWRWQFGRDLVTDYRIAMSQRRG